MKIFQNKVRVLAIALGALVASGGAASAQNLLHAPSDLILTFQNPGGTTGATQTLTVALGNVSTVYRNATPSSVFNPNSANIANLGTTLSSTFGASWFDETTLWAGAVGFRGATLGSQTLNDLDPTQTIYFTKVRSSVGTIGSANSGGTPTINANTGTNITGAIGQVKGRIEAAGTTAIFAESTSTSFIDNQNPFTSPGVQNAAYAEIGGGVQGNFGAGSFGTFGSAGAVELALDLFRVQTVNNVPGQFGFGGPINTGSYLGTLTINNTGGVAFTAVPEPSTYAMLILAAVGLGLVTRRRSAQSQS